MRGLRYPRLILERLGFPLASTQTLQVLASSYLPRQIFNFSSNLLTGSQRIRFSCLNPQEIRTKLQINL